MVVRTGTDCRIVWNDTIIPYGGVDAFKPDSPETEQYGFPYSFSLSELAKLLCRGYSRWYNNPSREPRGWTPAFNLPPFLI
jgi:hypothetical protein